MGQEDHPVFLGMLDLLELLDPLGRQGVPGRRVLPVCWDRLEGLEPAVLRAWLDSLVLPDSREFKDVLVPLEQPELSDTLVPQDYQALMVRSYLCHIFAISRSVSASIYFWIVRNSGMSG